MGFQTIGFHAALILNRLRAERQITENDAANDHRRREQQDQEERVRAEFKRVNARLVRLNKKLGQ